MIKYNPLSFHGYLLVFLISGILRYAASIIFIPKLKEMRIVEDISYNRLLIKAMSAVRFNEMAPVVVYFKNKFEKTKKAFKNKLR